ncbi:UBN2_3 domain-containing protein, partial [Cephalotus follicularis]
NPAYLNWCQRDQLVLSWINTSLSEYVLPLVVVKLTSAATWPALTRAFGSPSHSRILQLHMQLQNLKKYDSPIVSYLHQAKYISDELTASGKILSPKEFNNLGSSFHAIVAAISTKSTLVLFPELLSPLTSEEIHFNDANTPIELPSANIVSRTTKPDGHSHPGS